MAIDTFEAESDERLQALNEEQRLYSVYTNIMPSISMLDAMSNARVHISVLESTSLSTHSDCISF